MSIVKCKNCHQLFERKNEFQRFCSLGCKELCVGERVIYNMTSRNCCGCGIKFSPNFPNQKFCKQECRENWETSQCGIVSKKSAVCDVCGQVFVKKNQKHRFCCAKCRETVYAPPVTEVKSCDRCGKNYETYIRHQKFCGESCRKDALEEQRKANSEIKTQSTKKIDYAKIRRDEAKVKAEHGVGLSDQPLVDYGENREWIDSLGLNLWKESQFVEWFKNNHLMFGVKRIVKLDVFFPDCIAEMVDGRTLNIELEYDAKNFELHKHDHKICDLIISYKKKPACEFVLGVPVLSMFNYSKKVNGDEIRTMTPYLRWLTSMTGKAVGMIVNRNAR